MSTKQLNTNSIVNELKDSSLFFAPSTDLSNHDSSNYNSANYDPSSRNSKDRDTSSKDALQAPVMPPPVAKDAETALDSSSPITTSHDPLQRATRTLEPDTLVIFNSTPTEFSSSLPISPTEPNRDTATVSVAATNVGTNERSDERRNERRKVRHSFDIRADQLFTLREIAVVRERVLGQKVLLGDLVQEALDLFMAHECENA